MCENQRGLVPSVITVPLFIAIVHREQYIPHFAAHLVWLDPSLRLRFNFAVIKLLIVLSLEVRFVVIFNAHAIVYSPHIKVINM